MPKTPATRLDLVGDSSRALGLTHGYRDGAISPEVFDRGGDRLPKPGRLRELEIADRQKIIAGEKAVWERDVAKALAVLRRADPNATRLQAEAAVKMERRNKRVAREQKSEERQERARKQAEYDMGVHRKSNKHGSSNSGRRRSAKKGTWLCKECHLEFCEHRPVRAKKGGRPPRRLIGRAPGPGRSKTECCSVSDEVSAARRRLGISAGEIVEVVIRAAIGSNLTGPQLVGLLETFSQRADAAA